MHSQRRSRVTAATLFPRLSGELLERWSRGECLAEHGDVHRLRPLLDIAELSDIRQVLALEPGKISAYGLSSAASEQRRKGKVRHTLQSINHLTPDQAQGAYDAGLSILCGDLLPLIPELRAQLEGLLGDFGLPALGTAGNRLLELSGAEPLEAVMSFSPAGAHAALGLHYDAFEVISIQLTGTKVWMLGANEDVAFPLSSSEARTPGPPGALATDADADSPRRRRSGRSPELKRIEMRPGSVLFVPRGHWHCTQEVSRDEPSVSLVLKLTPPTFLEAFVTALFAQLAERPEWRVPAVGLFRPGELRAGPMQALRELVAGVRLDADDLVLRHYMPELAPPELLAFSWVDGASLRADRRERGAPDLVLHARAPEGDVEFSVDSRLAGLCDWLARGQPRFVSLAEALAHAGRADEAGVQELLDALCDAGVLSAVIAPAPPAQPAPLESPAPPESTAPAGRSQAGRAQAGRAQAGRAQAGRARAGQARSASGAPRRRSMD